MSVLAIHSTFAMVNWKTLAEISEHLKTSTSTVYKLKERGVIRGYRVGRNLRFDPDEVDEDIKRANARRVGVEKSEEEDEDQKAS